MRESSAVHDFDTFADDLHVRRARIAHDSAVARRERDARADDPSSLLVATSRLLDAALAELGSAEDEIRAQNEALFDARFDLEASAMLYRELFEMAPVAYLVTDVGGKILRVNSSACALLGRPTNVLVDKQLASYVALDERAAFREALRRSAQSRDVEEWPICITPRAHDPVDCRVRVRVLRAPTGDVHGLGWIIVAAPPDPLDL